MKFLRFLWRKWLPIAQAVGNFQAQVILTFFYLVIFLPLGLFFRLFRDPLKLRARGGGRNFSKWAHPKQNLDEARKQY